MTKVPKVFLCEKCGNVVELINEGGGTLVCCGQNMTQQSEKSEDQGTEKHKPVVEKLDDDKIRIRVGSVDHPMADDHFIKWIEVISDEKTLRKYFNPGDKPEKEFFHFKELKKIRAFCNKHGVWTTDF